MTQISQRDCKDCAQKLVSSTIRRYPKDCKERAHQASAPQTTRPSKQSHTSVKTTKAAKKPAVGKPNAPDSAQARRAQAFANPRIALHARMATAGCKAPNYSFDSPDECVATVVDADGKSYSVTIPGKNDKATRNKAAALLLTQLPPRPLNKRGDMWQGSTNPVDDAA